MRNRESEEREKQEGEESREGRGKRTRRLGERKRLGGERIGGKGSKEMGDSVECGEREEAKGMRRRESPSEVGKCQAEPAENT